MHKFSDIYKGQVRTLHAYIFAFAKMTEMIIPGTVNEIKDYAFYNCTELGSIRFEAGTTLLTIGFQPAGLLENERGPFYQSPLTSIYIDRDVTVTLQSNAVISDYMFSGVGLRTIWILREISRIGFRAFHNCSKLSGMTLAHTYATHPMTLEKGSDEAWSEFANIIVAQKKQ